MTLKDISNGPNWVLWVVLVIFAVLSAILLSGHGANLIAGYNTSSKEEQAKFNEKKLCRVTGCGMLVVTILILVTALWEAVLPAWFIYIFIGLVLLDVTVMIILTNTICRK